MHLTNEHLNNKANIHRLWGEIDSNMQIVEEFNTLLSSVDRSYRQKINKGYDWTYVLVRSLKLLCWE